MSGAAALVVGLISDTHGLLRPEALAALAGSDHIVHAGDIGDPVTLEALREMAPLTAIRGNNDTGAWARDLPDARSVEVGGVRIHVIHDLAQLGAPARGVRLVVCGHSHVPRILEKEGVLYVNPGSAGPRRFRLPVSIGRLAIAQGKVTARLTELEVAPPRKGRRRR